MVTMKKINGIDTISAQEQIAIIRWYSISKQIIIVIISLLITITCTQWYLLRRYTPSCKPCITASYAEVINKKHAEKTSHMHTKKTVKTEQERGNTVLKNYLSFIESHLNKTSSAQLTDVRLTPQGFDAHYSSPHRSAVQHQLKELSENTAVKSVSLHSIEQKNTTTTSSFSGTWKEIQNI